MRNEIEGVKKKYHAPVVEDMGALGDVTMSWWNMGMMNMGMNMNMNMGMMHMNFGS